jgi:hypothetical protein
MKRKIIHLKLRKKEGIRYACNQAVGVTKGKYTYRLSKVTCKNCLLQINKKK